MNQHNELHCQVSRFPPVDIWQRGNGVILTAISKGSKRKIVYLQQLNEVLASIVPQKCGPQKSIIFNGTLGYIKKYYTENISDIKE